MLRRFFFVVAFLSAVSTGVTAQMVSVSIIQTSLPPHAWHNVVSLGAGSGQAWVHGGQTYDPAALYYNTSYRIDLATGDILATGTMPYAYAHSSAIDLSGHTVIVGGMGVQPGGWTTFKALESIQWFNTDASSGWLTSQLPYGTYDIEAVALTPTRLVYIGGHEVLPTGSESEVDGGVVELSGAGFVKTAPLLLSVPRVYTRAIPLDAETVLVIGGGEYTNIANGLRPVGVIETLSIGNVSRMWAHGLNAPRRYHSAVLVPALGKVFVAGGTLLTEAGRPAATNRIEVLDLATETVTELAPMLRAREHGHLSYCRTPDGKNLLVFDGGQSADLIPVTDIEVYDVDAQTSTIVGQGSPSVDHDRITVADGNVISRFGGEDATTGIGTTQITRIEFPTGSICSR